jgi:hypothetical protein
MLMVQLQHGKSKYDNTERNNFAKLIYGKS